MKTTKSKKARIQELQQLISKWDDLAKNNPGNIHNLSTSERTDWVCEILELKGLDSN